jgi:hypothetical protein
MTKLVSELRDGTVEQDGAAEIVSRTGQPD